MTYVFVGGVARSGTTLLYGVLCSGPQSNPALFESHLVPLLLDLYRQTQRRGVESGWSALAGMRYS